MRKIVNLSIEGCGVKGIAYAGALKKLEDLGILGGIKRVSGCSAGGITAFLLSLGYNATRLKEIVYETDFSKFPDASSKVMTPYYFFKYFGIYKGLYYENWIKDYLEIITGSRDTTFAELKKLDIGPDLYVIGSNLCTKNFEIFSAMTTPNMKVSTALRITMSIPFYFRAVRYNNCVYTDGGVFCNFPIQVFDDERFITDEKTFFRINIEDHPKIVHNLETLGLRIDSESEINAYNDPSTIHHGRVKNMGEFIYSLIGSLMNTQVSYQVNHLDWQRSVFIPNMGIGTVQFNLSLKDKNKLYESGFTSTEKFFQNSSEFGLI